MNPGFVSAGQLALLAACALGAVHDVTHAQGYPLKPIRLIVPFPAGGGTDAIARMFSDRLGARLGQPVVIDNKAGAGGLVGTEAAVRAAPDGYTLVLGTSGTVVMAPHLKKLPYDPTKDLAPVGQITTGGLVMAAHPSAAIGSVTELVGAAKGRSGGLSYATGGMGTGGHIVGESVKYLLRLPLVHVGYKGTAAATTDVIGGHVPLLIVDTQVSLPHIKSGRLKTVAVPATERAPCLPDTPTLREQGVPFELTYWWGLMAPVRTPTAIVEQLNKELQAVLNSPEVQAQLREFCQGSGAGSVEQFRRTIARDNESWGKLIREARIEAE